MGDRPGNGMVLTQCMVCKGDCMGGGDCRKLAAEEQVAAVHMGGTACWKCGTGGF